MGKLRRSGAELSITKPFLAALSSTVTPCFIFSVKHTSYHLRRKDVNLAYFIYFCQSRRFYIVRSALAVYCTLFIFGLIASLADPTNTVRSVIVCGPSQILLYLPAWVET